MSGTPGNQVARKLAGLASVLAVCAWCGWLSGFHRRTPVALATWVVSLAAVLVVHLLLWRGRHGRRWALRPRTTAERWPRPAATGKHPALSGALPWALLALVGVAWDVLGLDTGPHEAHLTLSALTQAYRPLNAALLLLWLLLGAGYGFARARSPGGPAPAESGAPRACVAVPALLLPSVPAVGVAFWVGLAAVAGSLDLLARRSGRRLADAGDIARLVGSNPVVNAFATVAWGYAGYHLFAY